MVVVLLVPVVLHLVLEILYISKKQMELSMKLLQFQLTI
jgi:hypothetical protein